MREILAEQERKRVIEVADEYRNKGYKVTVRPTDNQIPRFLKGFSPDIIASNAEETVILEVKSKASLSQSMYFSSLAERIKSHPRFRFELIVTNPRQAAMLDREILDRESISRLALDARTLLEKKHYEAALLLSWAVVESVLRTLAQREEVILDQISPSLLLKQLTSLGLITRSDYKTLERSLSARNALVHGFKPKKLTYREINGLITVAGRILEGMNLL